MCSAVGKVSGASGQARSIASALLGEVQSVAAASPAEAVGGGRPTRVDACCNTFRQMSICTSIASVSGRRGACAACISDVPAIAGAGGPGLRLHQGRKVRSGAGRQTRDLPVHVRQEGRRCRRQGTNAGHEVALDQVAAHDSTCRARRVGRRQHFGSLIASLPTGRLGRNAEQVPP